MDQGNLSPLSKLVGDGCPVFRFSPFKLERIHGADESWVEPLRILCVVPT
jgi:hypothetical protein